MDHSYESTMKLAAQIIELHRICDIVKDYDECKVAYSLLHSVRTDYGDGDVEYSFRVFFGSADRLIYQPAILQTFKIASDCDEPYIFKTREGVLSYTYTQGIDTIKKVSYSTGNIVDRFDALSIDMCTEAMFNQMIFLHDPEIVHSIFIISIMNANGLRGTFQYDDCENLDALLEKLRSVWNL